MHRVSAVVATLAVALVVSLVVAAQDAPPAGTPDAACPSPVGGTPAADASPVASPAACASPAAGDVVIELVDIAFEPEEVAIPADTPVTMALPNTGLALHNFSVDALGISVDVPPGQIGSVTITAPAGIYEFYCDIPGHAAAGMVGTLIVE
jgi:plastocyanin